MNQKSETPRQTAMRKAFYIGLFVAAFAISAAVWDPEYLHDTGRKVGVWWREMLWDHWNKGVISWHGHVLKVAVPQYGWIAHDDGDLEIFPRNAKSIASLELRQKRLSESPVVDVVEGACSGQRKKLCAGFEDSVRQVGSRRLRVVRYEDLTPGLQIRFSGFVIDPATGLVMSIGAENAADLDNLVALSASLAEQMAGSLPP